MDWDDLRFVLALLRAGQLSEAGRALGVARTTVGRRIRELEQELGVRLFDRTPEGFVPTPAGERLAETAARVEAQVLAVQGEVRGQDAQLSGRLRVSTVGFVFENFPQVFRGFTERYPGVDLTVHVSSERASLRRREADVALRISNTPDPQLWGRKVGLLHFEAYAARALVERLGPKAPLSAYPWLHADERGDTRWLDDWLAEHAPGAQVVLRSNDYAAMRAALRMGWGAHFLPTCEGGRMPELLPLGARLSHLSQALWLLTLPELKTNSRIRAFMAHAGDALAAELAAWP
ncbi:MAG: LysR family transcriptional regulator [Myxococcota bacterium]|nr:LysR family transcriptional regulator [Myxococcota bacterium]